MHYRITYGRVEYPLFLFGLLILFVSMGIAWAETPDSSSTRATDSALLETPLDGLDPTALLDIAHRAIKAGDVDGEWRVGGMNNGYSPLGGKFFKFAVQCFKGPNDQGDRLKANGQLVSPAVEAEVRSEAAWWRILNTQELDDSASQIELTRSLDPKNFRIYLMLAFIEIKKGSGSADSFHAAMKSIAEALLLNPISADAFWLRSQCEAQLGQSDLAMADIHKFLDHHDDIDLFFNGYNSRLIADRIAAISKGLAASRP